MNEENFSPVFKVGSTEFIDFREVSREFEMHLENLINEIYNPDIPFMQVSNLKICRNCDYINICKREE